jgi:hypothetical protein
MDRRNGETPHRPAWVKQRHFESHQEGGGGKAVETTCPTLEREKLRANGIKEELLR